jgi:anti-sigma-K factor RskA
MSDRDDIAADEPLGPDDAEELLAAEYVLRLLPSETEADAQVRELGDTAFAARVARWRERFADLAAEDEPVAPPRTAWAAIQRRLFAPVPQERRSLLNSLGAWRTATAGFAALAGALALLLATLAGQPQPTSGLVSSLDTEEGIETFLVIIDRPAGTLRIARTIPAAPEGSTYELWFLDDSGVPESLGLLPEDTAIFEVNVDPSYLPRLREGVLIEVTQEPETGSPTGGPTGPVLGLGRVQSL